jgi:cellulose synthase/poly-beta-1,6-N-acetylglucosamine synthase-like glycosyltransferase
VSLLFSFVFWLGALWLLYVYWGYGALLGLLAPRSPTPAPLRSFDERHWPSVTVLLTVHNEERVIERRLKNLLTQDYPPERLDIVVASDGSTDRTEALVEAALAEGRIRLARTDRLGKSVAQNVAMHAIESEVVVLTDAETVFDPACVRAMAAEFADPKVGCVTAELGMVDATGAIGRGQSRYWSYELKLRRLESRLGILAVASGPAMAFRRALFAEIPSFTGDDCVIPLEVVSRGHRVVHCAAALAWDCMDHEPVAEFRSRVRMTVRNWIGTWLYPALLDPRRHPGHAFALWSHKLLRWLGGFALAAMAPAAAGMAIAGTERLIAAGFALFLLAGFVGWLSGAVGRAVPLAGIIYAFLLANLGFMTGVVLAALGRRIDAYRSGTG